MSDSSSSKNNISSHTKDLSHLSHLSQVSHMQQLTNNLTREIIEEFFYDDGLPYRPPSAHTLDESPCKLIIKIIKTNNDDFYYCSVHPDVQNIHLESIEHHMKYKHPEMHKSEILKMLDNQNSVSKLSSIK